MDTTLADPLVGRVLDGRYRIDAQLAGGGMGTVYTAVDTRLDRPVAVKVMQPAYAADPAFVARFISEARAAARLSHPNVVAVFDQGSAPAERGGPPVVFLVMEYVAGVTLRQLLTERGRLPAGSALALLEPVLSALGAAHAAGLVHRDVKPENVLLATDGQVKVADFGLARAVEGASATASVTMLIGTVAYLAPEQITTGAADARTDVYAAGILLYELVTGHPPFDGPNAMAVAFRHVHEDVPRASMDVRGLPRQVDDLILRATARNPARRFADAREFLGAVRPALARAGSGGGRGWRLRRAPAISLPAPPASGAMPWTAAGVPVAGAAMPGSSVPGPAVPQQSGNGPTGQPSSKPLGQQTTGPTPSLATRRLAATTPTARHPRTFPRQDPRATLVVPELPAAVRRSRGRRGGRFRSLVALVLTAAVALTGWWLALGRYTETPSLLAKSKPAANSVLAAAGLQAQWLPDRFSATVPAGRVTYARPSVGERVRDGGTVTMALSKGPEVHKLPKLVSAPLATAQRSLAAIKLRSSVRRAYSDTVRSGSVVSTKPSAGTRLHPGDLVTLTVSRGREPIDVPDVRSQSLEEAEQVLTELDFTIKRTEEFSDSVPQGDVIRSIPAAGRTAPHATAVGVVVSKGPQLFPIPDVRRMASEEAARTLQAAGFRVRTFAPFGFGQVHMVSPKVGTMVARDTTVSIIVY